jgi:hypothetical protein
MAAIFSCCPDRDLPRTKDGVLVCPEECIAEAYGIDENCWVVNKAYDFYAL